MKRVSLLLFFVFAGHFLFAQQDTTARCPYYWTSVSNPNKTINYLFGFYFACNTEMQSSGDGTPFTSVTVAVINKSTTDLSWDNNKVCVLLKSGAVIRNYTTAATDGDYACTYKVANGVTHHQRYCFHTMFTANDVSKVWLLYGDDKTFDLDISANK